MCHRTHRSLFSLLLETKNASFVPQAEADSNAYHFGDDFSEQVEYVSQSFKIIRYVRPKFVALNLQNGELRSLDQ